jgi:hypothetical protein
MTIERVTRSGSAIWQVCGGRVPRTRTPRVATSLR